ncbi:MAG: O-antigen ligase family protein [Candidatus Aminicenantaceae bacterium]
MALYDRSFAYLSIRVGSQEIYFTEAILFLGFVLFLIMGFVGGEIYVTRSPLNFLFVLYFTFGIFALLRGFNEYKIDAIRDSVLVYYALFFFIFLWTVNKIEHVRSYVKYVLLLIIIMNIFFIIRLVNSYSPIIKENVLNILPSGNEVFWGFGPIFYCATFSMIRRFRKTLFFIVTFPLAYDLFTYFRRSLFLGVGVSLVFVYFFSEKSVKKKLKKFGSIILILTVIAIIFVLEGDIQSLWEGHASGAFWRETVWIRMMPRIFQRIFFGYGFGPEVVPTELLPDFAITQDPHNSFLAILFRIGVTGFGVLCIILVLFYSQVIKFLKVKEEGKIRNYALAFLGCHVFMIVFSLFNVVLEGPHHGIWFWIIMGITAALFKIEKKNRVELECHSEDESW